MSDNAATTLRVNSTVNGSSGSRFLNSFVNAVTAVFSTVLVASNGVAGVGPLFIDAPPPIDELVEALELPLSIEAPCVSPVAAISPAVILP